MIIDSLQKENSKDNIRTYKMVNSVNDKAANIYL